MNRTILPKKTVVENPIATNDIAETALISDPSVSQFTNNGMVSSQVYNQAPTVTEGMVSAQYNNTQAAEFNAASNADVLVKNTNEDWINKRWRPAMGWMYMAVCIFDFILAPILWSIIQFWEVSPQNDAFRQWNPLTLQGAGLFHMAMGAVLGIAAYGRTKEKLDGKN